MRNPRFLAGALATTAALAAGAAAALELPRPEDTDAQALLARADIDVQKLEAAWNFSKPDPQQWPCEPPKAQLYLLAGLIEALKPEELPPGMKSMDEIRKEVRRSQRQAGMDFGKQTTSYSNIVLIPVKAACTDGKLQGDTEFFVSYDSSSQTKSSMFSEQTKKMEEVRNLTKQSVEKIVHAVFQAGEPGAARSDVSRSTFEVQMQFDDPVLRNAVKPMPPQTSRGLTRTWEDGSVSFAPLTTSEVSAGLFIPSVKAATKLSTQIMYRRGKFMTTLGYTDRDLTTRSRHNTEKNVMATVMYMDNFYKKMGLKRTEMPGTENQKEVVINGKDMLEQQLCIVNNVPAKVDPCPVE